MNRPFIDRATIESFIGRLDALFARPGRLYLVGETTQVFERWLRWTDQVHFCAEIHPDHQDHLAKAVQHVQTELGIDVLEESPGDVIPLPPGYSVRAKPIRLLTRHLQVCHFDPYSVAFRFLAGGDERDYHLILTFLQHGWLKEDEMGVLLDALLPQFTFETIQQDPAEFRRRYKGLLQMWHAARPVTSDHWSPPARISGYPRVQVFDNVNTRTIQP